MGFSINTKDLPRLHNYQSALQFYERAKRLPRRSGYPDTHRMLGSQPNKRIELGGGKIYCWLYQTPVLVYYPDGTIMIDSHYNTQSTRAFLDAVGPLRIETKYGGAWANCDGKFYCVSRGNGRKFIRRDGQWVCTTPHTVSYKRINLKKAAAARRPLQGYRKYEVARNAFGPEDIPIWYPFTEADSELLTVATNSDNYPDLYESGVEYDRLLRFAYRQNNCYDTILLPEGSLPKTYQYTLVEQEDSPIEK